MKEGGGHGWVMGSEGGGRRSGGLKEKFKMFLSTRPLSWMENWMIPHHFIRILNYVEGGMGLLWGLTTWLTSSLQLICILIKTLYFWVYRATSFPPPVNPPLTPISFA